MADRLNDTDPQSPVALQSRTDPGLGGPPPSVVARAHAEPEEQPLPPAPVVGSASIEQLLDGITGPRPPPSRRDGPESESRAYSAARPAPPSHPTPPLEPAVLSPTPPPALVLTPTPPPALYSPPLRLGERDALTVQRGMPDPSSIRPVVRRAEERTVYTGRRAMVRNSVAVVLSGVAVTAAMMAIVHWKEARGSASAVLAPIVEAPLPPAPEVAPAGPAPTIVIMSPPPPPPPAAATVAASPAPAPSASPAPLPKRLTVPGAKRSKVAPAQGSLDDLNREISH